MTYLDEEELPPTTMPPGVVVSISGFHDAEVAQRFGHAIIGCLQAIGTRIDLTTLDAVKVAIDYDQALAEVDRGMEGLRPLTRSNTQEIQGVAMSPAVMRDGVVKTQLVFSAGPLAALIVDEATEDDVALALGVLAHECAHVEITARKEQAIPEARLGTSIEGFERALFFQVAEVLWDEYAACRISAPFARNQNIHHADSLEKVVAGARQRANEAIKQYRVHGDINRLVGEAGSELFQPFKVAAYLLGGMDGESTDWAEMPTTRAAVEAAGYAPFIDELQHVLRTLWDSQKEWSPTLYTFEPLEVLAKGMLEWGGIIVTTNSDGCRVDVPYTFETMPL